MKNKITKNTKTLRTLGIKKFLNALPAPDGFTKEIYREKIGWHKKSITRPAVRFCTNDVEIQIIMGDMDSGSAGDGHTFFDTVKGRKTFDRTGVEDSFYIEAEDTLAAASAKVQEQINRIAESRARLTRSVTVPHYGYNLTLERLAEHQLTLRKGGRVQLAPAGFGTGHTFSMRPSRWAHPCRNDVNNFFGIGMLFVETFDHD
jgi:hypothetical protein